MENKHEAGEYEAPEVVDYGTLEEMTLKNGTAFNDSPLGNHGNGASGSHA